VSTARRWALAAALVAASACAPAAPVATPPIVPGTSAAPREVNLIARDYVFVPATLDVVPGETVVLHVINGGLTLHEAIIGDTSVQDAWEAAEAVAADPPPGPTPMVSVPPDVAGIRIVVTSGQRVDVTWTVPADTEPLVVGCHIPGHWAEGMWIPVRFVVPTPPEAAAPTHARWYALAPPDRAAVLNSVQPRGGSG
jgi:uncharacterized cupredoxin-like copper-binding protein